MILWLNIVGNWFYVRSKSSFSADVGSGKECNKIFEKTIEFFNVTADECVFVDNKQKNLIIPEGMGMNVIFFDHEKRNCEKLNQEFRELSIIL